MTSRERLYGNADGEELPIRDRPYESFGEQGVAMPTYAPSPYDPDEDPVLGGASPGGGVTRIDLGSSNVGRGPRGWQRSDERIRDEVCERLTAADDVDASGLDVDVDRGEVILSGDVRDRGQRYAAEDVAAEVAGVVDVVNRIRVRRGSGREGPQ